MFYNNLIIAYVGVTITTLTIWKYEKKYHFTLG